MRRHGGTAVTDGRRQGGGGLNGKGGAARFCTVFGFSLFGRVGVCTGISQWYRVGDAGALRAEPLATLCLARS